MKKLSDELIKYGIEVFNTKELFEKWLITPRPFFNNQKPIEMSEKEIKDELGRIEWGVY